MKPLESGFTFRLDWLDWTGSKKAKQNVKNNEKKTDSLCFEELGGGFLWRTWGVSCDLESLKKWAFLANFWFRKGLEPNPDPN
jgi:hypothetical protein